VAATVAGVLSLDDALGLVAARGRLMQSVAPGSMLAVPLPEQEVRSMLDDQLSIAAINGRSLCVVSGETEAIAGLEKRLNARDVACNRLHTSHAFHSKMMETIVGPFIELVRHVQLNPPLVPYISNVTGTWITASQATDPNYWGGHLRKAVRFADGLDQLLREPFPLMIEVGPGNGLSGIVRQHSTQTPITIASLRHPKDRNSDLAFFLNLLGRLWLSGAQIDWARLSSAERPKRVPLPTYPFERQRYWIEKARANGAEPVASVPSIKPEVNGKRNGKYPAEVNQLITHQLEIISQQLELLGERVPHAGEIARAKAQRRKAVPRA
jgi:acyl transferase domain-containing protein